MQFHRPFGQFGAQAARQFVSLVEVDVEQRDADAQRADASDLLILDGAGPGQTLGQIAVNVKVEVDIRIGIHIGVDIGINRGRFIGHELKGSVGQRFEPGAQVDEVKRRIEVRSFNDIGYRQRPDGSQVEGFEQRIGRGVQRDRNTHRHEWEVRPSVERHVQPGQFEIEIQITGHGRLRGRWLDLRKLRRATQVQVEVKRQTLRRAGRSGGKRSSSIQLDSRGCRSSQRRWSGGKLGARRGSYAESDKLRGSLHGVRGVRCASVGCEVFNPRSEIIQTPFREFEQRRSSGAVLRQLRVVELLANPGRLAELVKPDHAGTALQRVESSAHGG